MTGAGVLTTAPWQGLAEKLTVLVYLQWMFVMAWCLYPARRRAGGSP